MIAYLRYTNAELLVAMHNHAIKWLIEDICNTGADICEKSDRIADEVGRAQDSVHLTEHVLSIVEHDSALKFGHRQPHILDCQSI